MAAQDNVFGQATVTPKGKLSFFDIDTPNTAVKHPKNQYPSDKFDITLMIPKDTDLSALKAECDKVATQAFKTVDGVDMPFANGDEKAMDSMKGHIILRAKSSKRPGCIDGSKARITEEEVRAGMWAKMQVTPMSYLSGKTKGVTLLLKNVQVLTSQPYDSLEGGAKAEDVFDAEGEDNFDSFGD
jgi:hypothetical protein